MSFFICASFIKSISYEICLFLSTYVYNHCVARAKMSEFYFDVAPNSKPIFLHDLCFQEITFNFYNNRKTYEQSC